MLSWTWPGQARGDGWRVHLIDHLLDAFEEFAGDELIGVVLDECDLRAILLVDAAREIVRDGNYAADEACF